MSGLVSLYEGEVCKLLDDLKAKNVADGDSLKLQHLKGLEVAIKQLEAEARTQSNAATRRAVLNKTKEYRSELKRLRVQIERKELMNDKSLGSHSGSHSGSNSKAKATTVKMMQQTESLQNSSRVICEVEQVAAGISENLLQNRDTLLSVKARVGETSSMASQARKVLRSIERQQRFKKLIIYGAAGFVAFLLLIALYYILF